MIVKCNKIISPVTKEDLGDKSLWLVKGNKYVILALDWSSKDGIEAYIQTEHYKEPRFISLNGFEFISQMIPSSWAIKIQELGDEKIITMLPASWSHDGFFEDVENQELKAIELFNKEVEQIYREESII
ncbi:hypothetical protein [Rickettsiella grylli]|uniref:Uncharacterized protein n=1 Tax=Rickettsiella grylli TaxID=59196 RepID=A8PKA1_9COXI|nr:hypothetical protein [Rickettsiella grylli]EDP46294.1 hypothetical protein RICGR_0282 [Rickettsiella grylli]